MVHLVVVVLFWVCVIVSGAYILPAVDRTGERFPGAVKALWLALVLLGLLVTATRWLG